MGAVGKGVDARVVHQLPKQVLGGALPGKLAADLHFGQTQVVDGGDDDQALG